MSSKKSRVHPKYKTKYRVSNWADYDRSLVQRGNITIWMTAAALKNWNARPSRRRGGQRKYSDLAIETAMTLRLLFHLPLRQAEGFLSSIFELMNVHLEVPDHTTLSRRSGSLRLKLKHSISKGPIDLVIDSSGLSIFGEGQWAAAKHGGKGIQGWKKLHLGVDQSGIIVAQTLTDSNVDDASIGTAFTERVRGEVSAVIADGAYDTRAFYDTAARKGARVVAPPVKSAQVGGDRSPVRDKAVRRIRKVGRRRWKKETGYHRQARCENAFFRYKTILGDRLRSRGANAQVVEARLACNILNRMTELGRPESHSIGA